MHPCQVQAESLALPHLLFLFLPRLWPWHCSRVVRDLCRETALVRQGRRRGRPRWQVATSSPPLSTTFMPLSPDPEIFSESEPQIPKCLFFRILRHIHKCSRLIKEERGSFPQESSQPGGAIDWTTHDIRIRDDNIKHHWCQGCIFFRKIDFFINHYLEHRVFYK